MAHGVAAAVEVEIGVAGNVAVGGLIALRLIAQAEGGGGEGVGDAQGQLAGEAALAGGGGVGEGDGVFAVLPALEHPAAEAPGTAMELLGALVGLQGDAHAVDEAARAGDAVGVPPDHRAHIAAVVLVPGHAVVAQHHVHQIAVPVGHPQRAEGCAVGDDLGLQRTAAQDELLHGLSVPGAAKGLLDHCHSDFLLL